MSGTVTVTTTTTTKPKTVNEEESEDVFSPYGSDDEEQSQPMISHGSDMDDEDETDYNYSNEKEMSDDEEEYEEEEESEEEKEKEKEKAKKKKGPTKKKESENKPDRKKYTTVPTFIRKKRPEGGKKFSNITLAKIESNFYQKSKQSMLRPGPMQALIRKASEEEIEELAKMGLVGDDIKPRYSSDSIIVIMKAVQEFLAQNLEKGRKIRNIAGKKRLAEGHLRLGWSFSSISPNQPYDPVPVETTRKRR